MTREQFERAKRDEIIRGVWATKGGIWRFIESGYPFWEYRIMQPTALAAYSRDAFDPTATSYDPRLNYWLAYDGSGGCKVRCETQILCEVERDKIALLPR